MNDQINAMNQQFIKQAAELLKSAQTAKLPNKLQAMSEENIAKARETFENLEDVSKAVSKAMEKVSGTAQKGTLILNDKITNNVKENADAVMAAVTAIANAKSIPEAAKIQTDFIQSLFAKASLQTKELYELNAKIAKDTTDQFSKVAAKAKKSTKKGE